MNEHCSYLEYKYKKDGEILASELFIEAEKLLSKYQDLQGRVLAYRNIVLFGGKLSIEQYDNLLGIEGITSGNIENLEKEINE